MQAFSTLKTEKQQCCFAVDGRVEPAQSGTVQTDTSNKYFVQVNLFPAHLPLTFVPNATNST